MKSNRFKTRYYEYNRQGGGEKYSEFTEAEYLKAREEDGRWFISFGSSVLECEESEYRKYFSEKNHSDYAQKDKNGIKVIPLPLEECTYGGDFADSTEMPLEERVLEQISLKHDLEKLRKVIRKLEPHEREIIYQIFWNDKSKSELAKKFGITRQTMTEKVHRILVKMLNLFENKK